VFSLLVFVSRTPFKACGKLQIGDSTFTRHTTSKTRPFLFAGFPPTRVTFKFTNHVFRLGNTCFSASPLLLIGVRRQLRSMLSDHYYNSHKNLPIALSVHALTSFHTFFVIFLQVSNSEGHCLFTTTRR
jgi:hypothetical protein